jgi:hypothetical protein
VTLRRLAAQQREKAELAGWRGGWDDLPEFAERGDDALPR